MRKNKLLIAASVLLAIVIVSLAWHSFQPGLAAPLVDYTTLNGTKISSASLRGKVVLVNFWATTCTTCIAEMPALVTTFNKYHPQGFELIAVAMQYDRPDYVTSFTAQHQLPFNVALDLDGRLAQAFDKVLMTPTTFLINQDGQILKRYLGQPNFTELHALIEHALTRPS